jgi:TolB-like protein
MGETIGGNKMKMKTMKLAAFFAVLFLIIGCGSSKPIPASSGVNTGSLRTAKSAGDELGSALREISDYLNKRIKAGSKTVFLNIKSDWPDLSDYILSTLAENAVNDEVFSVVDRQQLDAIRSELNFQWSGEVSDASAQEIGQMLGAQSIVSGTVTTIGSVYRIQVRAIAVQTAAVQGQYSQNVDGKGATIAALTKKVVPAGSGASGPSSAGGSATASGGPAGTKTQTTTTTTSGQTAQPAQAAKTYKIGDIGPAGGIIFYAKNSKSQGWQYLEAAPSNTERELPMGELNGEAYQEKRVGTGKDRTRSMLEYIEKAGGVNTVYWYIGQMNVNGFNDWYLPSEDEMLLMYNNLYMQGIGDFRATTYWNNYNGGRMYPNYMDFSKDCKDNGTYSGTVKHRVRAIRQF